MACQLELGSNVVQISDMPHPYIDITKRYIELSSYWPNPRQLPAAFDVSKVSSKALNLSIKREKSAKLKATIFIFWMSQKGILSLQNYVTLACFAFNGFQQSSKKIKQEDRLMCPHCKTFKVSVYSVPFFVAPAYQTQSKFFFLSVPIKSFPRSRGGENNQLRTSFVFVQIVAVRIRRLCHFVEITSSRFTQLALISWNFVLASPKKLQEIFFSSCSRKMKVFFHFLSKENTLE